VPDPTSQQLAIALAVVGGVAVLAMLVTLLLAARLKKLRRQYAIVRGDGGDRDILATLGQAVERVGALDRRVREVERGQLSQAASSREALQNYALVRYDAFEDMGGRLSFSAALLDAHGDGIVITSINGRSETRTYAKPVKGLASSHNLSDEEREAISAALGGQDREWSRAPASQSL
jgi:uncharacterized protein YlxW (UPF0749 family)